MIFLHDSPGTGLSGENTGRSLPSTSARTCRAATPAEAQRKSHGTIEMGNATGNAAEVRVNERARGHRSGEWLTHSSRPAAACQAGAEGGEERKEDLLLLPGDAQAPRRVRCPQRGAGLQGSDRGAQGVPPRGGFRRVKHGKSRIKTGGFPFPLDARPEPRPPPRPQPAVLGCARCQSGCAARARCGARKGDRRKCSRALLRSRARRRPHPPPKVPWGRAVRRVLRWARETPAGSGRSGTGIAQRRRAPRPAPHPAAAAGAASGCGPGSLNLKLVPRPKVQQQSPCTPPPSPSPSDRYR